MPMQELGARTQLRARQIGDDLAFDENDAAVEAPR
jgi:hypothetical protein